MPRLRREKRGPALNDEKRVISFLSASQGRENYPRSRQGEEPAFGPRGGDYLPDPKRGINPFTSVYQASSREPGRGFCYVRTNPAGVGRAVHSL